MEFGAGLWAAATKHLKNKVNHKRNGEGEKRRRRRGRSGTFLSAKTVTPISMGTPLYGLQSDHIGEMRQNSK